MKIGIDFDNTIAQYDDIFHATAHERGLLESDPGKNKTSVRDYLRKTGREKDWILLQGYVYGACMERITPFPGAQEFVRRARATGHEVRIVSHKTRHANMGPKYDLHESARLFLAKNGFVGEGGQGIDANDAYFEVTREAKLARIVSEGCDVFIDDLPELLTSHDFPPSVRRYLFDPNGVHAPSTDYTVLTSWFDAIDRLIER